MILIQEIEYDSDRETIDFNEQVANEIRTNKINKLNEVKREIDAFSKQVQKYMNQKVKLKEIRKEIKKQLKENKEELKRNNKVLKLAKTNQKIASQNYDQEANLLNQVTADFKFSNDSQVNPMIYKKQQKQYKKAKRA